jgi:hypothetical protein
MLTMILAAILAQAPQPNAGTPKVDEGVVVSATPREIIVKTSTGGVIYDIASASVVDKEGDIVTSRALVPGAKVRVFYNIGRGATASEIDLE